MVYGKYLHKISYKYWYINTILWYKIKLNISGDFIRYKFFINIS